MKVDGYKDIVFEIGGKNVTHTFYIVREMNRRLILGKDWLLGNGVRMYYDLGCIRVNGVNVPLQEDIHISSVVRLSSKINIEPQTSVICKCNVRNTNKTYTLKKGGPLARITHRSGGNICSKYGAISTTICKMHGRFWEY